ncbi:MAG: beta-lactamase family protein [Verrucomicrobiales bacterium]|nr:beta-lactamase family protein [Verrucomicrobiales bacterium]
MKVLLVSLFTLAVSSAGICADSKIDELVSSIAERQIKAGRVVGVSIGIARGDEIVHLKGYGTADLENDVAATEKGVYRIGSITKMFTAAAILLLVEEEKLNLDDPLSKFIPDYPEPVGDEVTVLHLLQHTSGIFSFTDIPNRRLQMRMDVKHEEVVERFKDKPVHFEPGEKFRYCNSGYFLLGMIIEKVSGQKYGAFLEERIFQPLDLKSTYLDRNLRVIPHRVRGYAKWGENTVNANYTSMTQPFSAGAMASTAGDLIHWQRALVNGDLLKPESYEQMTTAGERNDGKSIPYGLGCFVNPGDDNKPKQIWHGGGIPGFISELVYFPESDLTIVILTNSMQAQANKMSREIASGILELEAD